MGKQGSFLNGKKVKLIVDIFLLGIYNIIILMGKKGDNDKMYEKLRELRLNSKVPVDEIIKKLGLSTLSAYYKKETRAVPITLEEAKIIADIFDKTVDEIFFNDELS